MICSYGDVAVVPFPFVERDVVKVRPAIVLSSEKFNRDNDSTVLAMITTASRSAWPADIAITDGPAAGLLHPSIVRWKVFSLPNALIARIAGRLTSADLEAVTRAGREVLFAYAHSPRSKT